MGGCPRGLFWLHLAATHGLHALRGALPNLLLPPLFCRDSCASGLIVSLRCSGESHLGSRKVAVGGRSLPTVLSMESPTDRLNWVWGGAPWPPAPLPAGPLLTDTGLPQNRALSKLLSCPPPATDLGRFPGFTSWHYLL